MKALSLWQPWGSLWCAGIKTNETRGWSTRYVGPLAIHAALHKDPVGAFLWQELWEDIAPLLAECKLPREFCELPFGALIGKVSICECVPTAGLADRLEELEMRLGDYSPGRFAWRAEGGTTNVPIPCGGRQGFFTVEVPEYF